MPYLSICAKPSCRACVVVEIIRGWLCGRHFCLLSGGLLAKLVVNRIYHTSTHIEQAEIWLRIDSCKDTYMADAAEAGKDGPLVAPDGHICSSKPNVQKKSRKRALNEKSVKNFINIIKTWCTLEAELFWFFPTFPLWTT